MKLVEILAKELAEWPRKAVTITQDLDSCVNMYDHEKPTTGGMRVWSADGFIEYLTKTKELADDYRTAIVTRAQWEAEKMKQAKPAEQEGKWVRHRGGKCPVDGDTVVDIRCRNGRIHEGEAACHFIWKHSNDIGDAMAYRLHKPEQQEESVADVYVGPFKTEVPADSLKMNIEFPSGVIHVGGPTAWRDRIRTIDTTVESLEEERASLVQRLEGEGFKLVRVDAKVLPKEPDADMSDWRNWKRGDRVRCVSHKHEWSDKAAVGKEYVLSEDPLEDGDSGLHIYVAGFYMNPEDFILVSL
jgi:hypothetical protein